MSDYHLRIGSVTFCQCADALTIGLSEKGAAALATIGCTYESKDDADEVATALRLYFGVVDVSVHEGPCQSSTLT